MKKFLTITTALAGLALVAATPAMATPLTGTFAVSVYQGSNPSGNQNAAAEQALPSAIGPLSLVSSFSYTGALNFSASANSVSSFFASGGGTISGGTVPTTALSTGGFVDATLIKFTFTTPSAIGGTITHDDGISVFAAGTTTTNLVPGASSPTPAVATSFALSAGTYDLYYSEVNGLPATLNFNVTPRAAVPEPVSMALLGTGLLSLGLVRRRNNRA